MTLSIRARLTLWYGGVMTIALVVLSGGVLFLHARWSYAQFDVELSDLAATVTRALEEELEESGNFQKASRETRTSTDVRDRATAILGLDAAPITAHWQGFEYDAPSMMALLSQPGFTTASENGRPWRLLARRQHSSAGDYFVFVAGSLDQVTRQQNLLRRALLVTTPFIVFLTAALSWRVASSALRPVTIMAMQAEAMTARSEVWSLKGTEAHDELGMLARAFNGLLNRLEIASRAQRQFMADASHELRTPVSVIQTAAEVTLDHSTREESEYREALTIVNEQSARLGRIVEDMLVLAQADAGGYRLVRRPLYIDEIVAECVRAVSVLAAARGIHLSTELQPDVALTADDGLLRQLTTNLLDNAVRYTPQGGSVGVVVSSNADTITIVVSDSGPGIPPADRQRVFDRFVRLDSARSATPGAGLGLPIARWIAELHRGTLTVESSETGALFVARLPRT